MSEAILTMYSDPERVKYNSREEYKAASIMRQEARLGSKVNISESVINLVNMNLPKMLSGKKQKVRGLDFGFDDSEARTANPPGKSRHLTFHVTYAEHGKPEPSPIYGQADRKRRC